jgi:transcriptional regulator with XRE-family HTH domain
LALSQRELARRAGVAQPVLSRIERGHAAPRFETLDRLLGQCGKWLELVERPGLGVDRKLIRDRLRLTPGRAGPPGCPRVGANPGPGLTVRRFGVRLDDVVGRVVSR